MVYRFYVSPVVGDGTKLNPYRAKVAEIIGPVGPGSNTDYSDLILDHKRDGLRFGILEAPQGIHNSVESDSEVIPIGPPFNDLPTYFTALEALEARGNDLYDAINLPRKAAPTALQIVRAYTRAVFFTNRLRRAKYEDILAFVNENREATVGSFPTGRVNQIIDNLIGMGYDLTSVTGTSTIGEVFELLTNQTAVVSLNFKFWDFDTAQYLIFTVNT